MKEAFTSALAVSYLPHCAGTKEPFPSALAVSHLPHCVGMKETSLLALAVSHRPSWTGMREASAGGAGRGGSFSRQLDGRRIDDQIGDHCSLACPRAGTKEAFPLALAVSHRPL